jgi:Tol biopolymer transport system component
MIPYVETLNTFAAAWAALLGGVLWQSTVLACLVAGVSFRYRHSSPCHTPVQAEPEQGQADVKAKGRLYVSAGLRYKPEGKDEEETHMIIAIDPATGKWHKIADKGHDCRVSPDRQTLVFSHNNEIWNCGTGDSNSPARISDKSGRPIWSPDGKYLVATKQECVGDGWKCETWRVDAAYGANPIRLPIPDSDWVEEWSPDGQWFVIGTDRHPPHGRGYQLYVMKTDGTQQRRLTEGGLNVYARFSPDGRKILYLHQTAKEGNSIWVVDVDGKNAREIVKEVDLSSPDGSFWSPDGKQLAVILFDWEVDEKGKKFLRASRDANYRIEIMNADGQDRRELKLADAKFTFIGSLGDWR